MPLKTRLPYAILFAAIICVANILCSKPAAPPFTPAVPIDTTKHSPQDTSKNPPKDTTTTAPPVIVDTSSFRIYVAGDTMIGGDPYAAVWKNGVIKEMPTMRNSWVTSIYVYNNDVYTTIAGARQTDPYIYWKNDVGVQLPDSLGFGHANYSITAANDNVYVTGTTHEIPNMNYGAVYWKDNGEAIHLVPQEITMHGSYGMSIATSNGDVYVAGFLDSKPVYWKNNKIVRLPVDTMYAYSFSIANSIAVNNGDVYIAGSENVWTQFNTTADSRAVYWKNNNLVSLTTDKGSVAKAIVVANNDVYIAGGIYDADRFPRATYWKNGEPVILNPGSYSIANAIAVHGSDVYVAGTIGYNTAAYWKNGTPVILGTGEANAIFIFSK